MSEFKRTLNYDEMQNLIQLNPNYKRKSLKLWRLKYDGSSYVGAPIPDDVERRGARKKLIDIRDNDFNDMHKNLIKANNKFDFLYNTMFPVLNKRYSELENIDFDNLSKELKIKISVESNITLEILEDNEKYLTRMLFKKLKSVNDKRRLFKSKAKMNIGRWNYFITITYSDEFFETEEHFERTIRKKISEYSTRYGWKGMLCFQYGHNPSCKGSDNDEENIVSAGYGRLHCHGIFCIPDDRLIGKLVTKTHYSKNQGKYIKYIHNTAFDKVGITDFQRLYGSDSVNDTVEDYCTRYVGRDNCKMYYTRGVPTEQISMCSVEDVFCMSQFKFGNVKCVMVFDTLFGRRTVPISCYKPDKMLDILFKLNQINEEIDVAV